MFFLFLAASFVRASPTDCEVIAATLRHFHEYAVTAGPSSGFVTLRYVVSDRSHVLAPDFERMAMNGYWGPTEKIKLFLAQSVSRDLKSRATSRSSLRDCAMPDGFILGEDRLLPADRVYEDDAFQKRFAPAEGIIYFTLPGYSDDRSVAAVVTRCTSRCGKHLLSTFCDVNRAIGAWPGPGCFTSRANRAPLHRVMCHGTAGGRYNSLI